MADYPDERYRRDPAFHQLVDMIYMMIKKADFTPTEIREACMLAQIHYETHNVPRGFTLSTEALKSLGMKRSGFDMGDFETHRDWDTPRPPQREKS